jgi:hypothetical protein
MRSQGLGASQGMTGGEKLAAEDNSRPPKIIFIFLQIRNSRVTSAAGSDDV